MEKFENHNADNSTSAHIQCRELVEIMIASGVRNAVISPGSRNAPLIIALAREPRISKWVITDERSAAFVAVGMAQRLLQPVMIVCTSGSALLNYAPAVSEAYYRQIPLIVVSADRPREWIDQNDSQTIRQDSALAAIVKRSYDLPSRCGEGDCNDSRWYANRLLNDAAITATTMPMGPVHINVPLSDPLCSTMPLPANAARIISHLRIHPEIDDCDMKRLANAVATTERVMIVAGFHHPSSALNSALGQLARRSNVAILTETISNLHNELFISAIDRTLGAMPGNDAQSYTPQLLITMGGALVSKVVKKFLRRYPATEEWRVGTEHCTIDTMQHLTMRIDSQPEQFFSKLLDYMPASTDAPQQGYAHTWHTLADEARQWHARYVEAAPWCDLKAFSMILPSIPGNYSLHLSNGTCIRYAQLFGSTRALPCYCNRGTSGIDGSTSTALGSSLIAPDGEVALLITGDMSFGYDLAGITSQYNSNKFKIIVMCNGGGNIFRFLNGTSQLPELERYFEVSRPFKVRAIADAFDLSYFEAHDASSLASALTHFYDCPRQAILAVYTPAQENAAILRRYFRM